ncbi:MAG: DUF4418 family protein [Spirochaetaceae bacterium]|jgi:hypothetical protein|nr:DUF4418 family protein [Spirochaetaceae bacterium]
MKIRITAGIAVVVLGLLTALGPRFLFKVCGPRTDGGFMKCHWTAQAEIGAGALTAVLGAALVFFSSVKIRLGLAIGVVLFAMSALLYPHALIGGCGMHTMPCRTTAFPALTVVGILTIAVGALYIAYLTHPPSAPPPPSQTAS